MAIVTIGIDLAKNVFAVHGVNEAGKPVPYSLEAAKELSDDPYWIRGVLRAYTETFDGAKQGN